MQALMADGEIAHDSAEDLVAVFTQSACIRVAWPYVLRGRYPVVGDEAVGRFEVTDWALQPGVPVFKL